MSPLLVQLMLASTYNSAAYGAGAYGVGDSAGVAAKVTLPFVGTLPVTGSSLLLIGGAALIGVSAGFTVWLRQRHTSKSGANQPSS